jgi:hypothetical protein
MYDKGMFHLEITGPAEIRGTLILPKDDKTYLVHCDIAQHMEKGMKAQLIVGKGGGTFPSIPGLTDLAIPDDYGPSAAATAASAQKTAEEAAASPASTSVATGDSGTWMSGTMIIGLLVGIFGTPFALRAWKSYFNGATTKDVLKILAINLKHWADQAIVFLAWLLREIKKRSAALQQRH